MQQDEQKSDKFKCHECGLTFSSEREQREHQEKAHRKGAGQGGGRQGGQGQYGG
jgi:uncharacterized C2H2 Zn-finger protein